MEPILTPKIFLHETSNVSKVVESKEESTEGDTINDAMKDVDEPVAMDNIIPASKIFSEESNVEYSAASVKEYDPGSQRTTTPISQIGSTMCFQTPSSRPTHYIEGAYNLRSFSITFWMRTPPERTPPCKVPFNSHWFDGCMLVIGAPAAHQSAFWTSRARTYRKRRGRNDFGVSMGSDGQLMFGLGHRSLTVPRIPWKGQITYGIPKFPVYKSSEYAGEDHTLHTQTKVNDGKWHHITVQRNASHYELVVYIDGVPHTCTNGLGRCVGNLTNHGRLTDTYFRAGLGWGFDGCMRDVQLHAATSLTALEHYEGLEARVRDDIAGTVGMGGVAKVKSSTKKKFGPYLVFYYYIANNESAWLHENFRQSIERSGNAGSLVLRPTSAGDAIFHGARWGFKLNMILGALKAQPPGAIILISDIDIVYFRPIAPIISYSTENRMEHGELLDMVFQRNDDDSMEANIGFMALRCNERVIRFWEAVRDMVRKREENKKPEINGGDQRVVNKFLMNPGILGTATDLRWGLLPPDICSHVYSTHRNVLGGGMYQQYDIDLFHANKGGHFTVEKGRSMKMDSIRRAVVSNEKQKNNAVVSNEKQKKDACICY